MVELGAWYASDSEAVITHIAFRGGAQEELLIVDSGIRARVLSLTTQQFRWASLNVSLIDSLPLIICSDRHHCNYPTPLILSSHLRMVHAFSPLKFSRVEPRCTPTIGQASVLLKECPSNFMIAL